MHTTSRSLSRIVKLGLVCGILAPVWWAGIIIYCAHLVPGYSHVSHFISELAARESPTQDLMRNLGFYFTGALYVLFALTMLWQFRRDWRALLSALLIMAAGAARIGAGMFPCEPGCDPHVISLSQEWHQHFAAAGYWLMMAAAIATGFAVNRYQGLQHVLAAGIGAAVWCAMFLAMLFIYPEWQGLFQRLASGVLSLWLLVFAVSLWRYVEHSSELSIAVAPPVRMKRRERRAAARRARR